MRVFYLRSGLAVLFILIAIIGLPALKDHIDPNEHKSDEQREDKYWIATSKYWLDRQACRFVGLCGLAHWHPDPAVRPWNKLRDDRRHGGLINTVNRVGASFVDEVEDGEVQGPWDHIPGQGERVKPGDWDGDPRVLKEVPQFVLDHAPLVHLCSKEQFWPSDIGEHLAHMRGFANYTSLGLNATLTVNNLDDLNEGQKGRHLYTNSKDDVEERPDWLGSAYNKPIPYEDEPEQDEEAIEEELSTEYAEYSSGKIPTEEDLATWFDPYGPKHKFTTPLEDSPSSSPPKLAKQPLREGLRKRNPTLPKPGGYSPAPAILVLVDKGSGILDAFWFYFYSYNLGTTVLNCRFGNHIGDWEHSLIRFHNGVPKAVFFSAHSGGLAYSYNAVEKGKGKGRDGRPVLYSALGSHAMYAQPGKHPYVLPFGILADVTDKGPLWDPAQNYLAYHYNTSITHGADARSIISSSSTFNATGIPVVTEHDALQPALQTPNAPMGWWWYNGHWGDKFYKLGDYRQWRFVGQYHYVNGPFGPRWKNLGRSKVCQSHGGCVIVDSLREGRKRSWIG